MKNKLVPVSLLLLIYYLSAVTFLHSKKKKKKDIVVDCPRKNAGCKGWCKTGR